MKRIVLLIALASIAIAPAAMAQSDIGIKNLGLAVGYVSPENIDGTFTIGGFADLGTMAPNLGLEARLDYWSWSQSQFGSEVRVSDVILGARGKYYFETANPRLRPFAGAGLAMHIVSFEETIPAFPPFPAETFSSSDTKIGLDIGGGILTPINPRTDFLGEAWYSIVSDWGQFSLRAGVQFKIGS